MDLCYLYFFQDLFIGAADTTTVTVEWAMKAELVSVVGKENQVEEEQDISRLPYLQAVLQETLRYHPTVPLLVPQKAQIETEINGYVIPKNSQVIVNFWAIGRDPSLWTNPEYFEPERFLETQVDYSSNNCTFIPFGSGRRMCPGQPLAHRMTHLMLASFIHGFDWKLEAGVLRADEIDIDEKFGLSLAKTVPLKAIPVISF